MVEFPAWLTGLLALAEGGLLVRRWRRWQDELTLAVSLWFVLIGISYLIVWFFSISAQWIRWEFSGLLVTLIFNHLARGRQNGIE